MKLKRQHIRHYMRFSSSDPWFLVGKGISDMSVEMNGTFNQTKDVTGEVSVEDEGYAPQLGVQPYYANTSDSIYEKIKDLAMNRKSGDDARAEYLEVWIDDDEAETHSAWKEDCIIEIVSYGGSTAGAQIPFNIWPDGGRVSGSVEYDGKVPTFSEG